MRRLWWLLALVAVAPGAAESLLENGGFEAGDPPAGWQLPAQSPITVDRAIVAEGRRSLTYNNLTPDKPGPWSISHSFAAPPAALLSVRGQLRPSAFRGSVRASLYLANPYTGSLQLMGESVLLSASQSSVTSGWRPFQFGAAGSPMAGRGVLRFSFQGSGQVWLDALELSVAAPPKSGGGRPHGGQGVWYGENLLGDSGFEGAGLPWVRVRDARRAQGVVATFDRGGGYRGRGCAQVTNHSAFSAEPAGWAQRVEVPGGHELVLVGRIRTRNLKGAAFLRLDCYGVAPGQQGGEPVRLASAASQEVTEGEQPWSEVRVRLRTPEGTRYVDAACLMQGRGTAWFDEVQLLPVRGE